MRKIIIFCVATICSLISDDNFIKMKIHEYVNISSLGITIEFKEIYKKNKNGCMIIIDNHISQTTRSYVVFNYILRDEYDIACINQNVYISLK